ncbi:MAG: hypothetical protein AVDCRST_MAG10-3690, partial [uncultured Acidimicrobiales bacterium]
VEAERHHRQRSVRTVRQGCPHRQPRGPRGLQRLQHGHRQLHLPARAV